MVRVKERDVYRSLLEYKGKSEPLKIGKAEVQVQLNPQDTHIGDSPDFILWLDVSVKIFAQNLRVRVPIPIEAESGGLHDALEDFQKFVERENFPIQLPMLVVSSKGYANMEQKAKLKTCFNIKQIPVRLLEY